MNASSSSGRPVPHSDAAALEATAIAWLTEREDGFSPSREHEFDQWLRADPRHAATVARLEKTLDLLGELPEFRAEINTAFNRVAPVVPFASIPAPAARRPHRWLRGIAWTGVAAALVLGVGVGWRGLRSPAEVRYATTVAGYERAQLADGSTLQLNAATAVRVHFTAASRHVRLETGEAYFAVAHDTARPFVVSVGGVAVRAVGTAFNVRCAPDGTVEVTVTEGKVRVDQDGPASAADSRAPLVAAGERLVLPKQAHVPVPEKLPPDRLRESLAWRSPLAEFAEAPLADVVARFNARNRLRLVLADAELGARRIGGTFALDEVEAFVRLLERDGEIVAERSGANEIRLRGVR